MKHRFWAAALSAALVLSSCPLAKAQTPEASFNLNPEGLKFPIMGYGVPRNNHKAYLDMAECGFTLCVPERWNLAGHLKNSEGTGVKLICFLPSSLKRDSDKVTFSPETINFIRSNKDNPQVAMWEFVDEPITVDKRWNETKLRNAVAKIRAIDPNHPIFLNWGAVQNNQYWNSSLSEFYSFDHYPLKHYNDKVAKSNWYYDTYYGRTWTRWVNDNVAACNLAYKNGTYWNGMAASIVFNGVVPEIEERHLRLAQFGNLACGAQMLSYYRYMEYYQDYDEGILQDYEDGSYEDIDGVVREYPLGKQHGAPVTYNNEKNPSWQMVKNVNDEINSLAGLFLGMRVETASVLNSDWKGNAEDGVPPLESFDNFTSNLNISVPSDERLLVSRFTNKGHTYIMCLNYWCKLDVHPTIKVGSNVLRIFSDVKAKPVDEGKISVTLAPGDYLIYRVL